MMSTPRRQIIRPPRPPAHPDPQRQRQVQKLRERLERERVTQARLMSRLKRVFHSLEKSQARLGRLERTLTKLENP
jgi:hypothetical protein